MWHPHLHCGVGPNANAWFDAFEERGVHLRPVHFYEPIPDTRALQDHLFTSHSALVGVDMNVAQQLALLSGVFPLFRDEYERFPIHPTANPHEYYFANPYFSGTDALVLYCMVRHLRPNLVLEVGSGYSSRVAALAARKNGNTRLVCIEPYPDDSLRAGYDGLGELITAKVQDVDLQRFLELRANDVLFIDSSHTVKCGSDVNYLFFEVLPRLQPGVVVHLHDIFLPLEYPKEWLLERHVFWNEQYLLQAFLTFNSEFEVLFGNAYMEANHLGQVLATFPLTRGLRGGSFWMRRRMTREMH